MTHTPEIRPATDEEIAVKRCKRCNVPIASGKPPSQIYCSRSCGGHTGDGVAPWNKGTGKGWTQDGYQMRYALVDGRKKMVREHRYAMEQHIGRKLQPWEVVHHKDHDRSNNDLSNLEVMEWGKHSTDHHEGSKRSYETRKTIETFALLREELKRLHVLNSELLAALERFADRRCRFAMLGGCVAKLTNIEKCDRCHARAAITKAKESR